MIKNGSWVLSGAVLFHSRWRKLPAKNKGNLERWYATGGWKLWPTWHPQPLPPHPPLPPPLSPPTAAGVFKGGGNGKKERRKEGRKEARDEGRKEEWSEEDLHLNQSIPHAEETSSLIERLPSVCDAVVDFVIGSLQVNSAYSPVTLDTWILDTLKLFVLRRNLNYLQGTRLCLDKHCSYLKMYFWTPDPDLMVLLFWFERWKYWSWPLLPSSVNLVLTQGKQCEWLSIA